jgi:hypothetical protein
MGVAAALGRKQFFTFEVTADASDDLFSLAIAQNCIANFAIGWLPDHTLIHPSIVQSHSSSFERGAITLFLVSVRRHHTLTRTFLGRVRV